MAERPTFLIVGASLTGAKAAETLREEGFDGRVILVGAEPHLPAPLRGGPGLRPRQPPARRAVRGPGRCRLEMPAGLDPGRPPGRRGQQQHQRRLRCRRHRPGTGGEMQPPHRGQSRRRADVDDDEWHDSRPQGLLGRP